MTNKSLKTIIRLSLVSAIYVALTLALYPLSYGPIQFRISEALMMLVAYNPIYSVSLIIGCLISNLASPIGVIDVIFGTLATAISCLMFKFKNKYFASLIPSIVNAIVIGIELQVAYSVPFYLGAFQVFLGEFVVVTLYGVPLFKGFENNEKLCELLEIRRSEDFSFENKYDKSVSFSISGAILGIILFFNLGVYNINDGNGGYNVYSIFKYVFDNYYHFKYGYLLMLLIFPFVSIFVSIFIKRPYASIINILCYIIPSMHLLIWTINIFKITNKYPDYTFYFYFVYYIINIIYQVYNVVDRKHKHLEDNVDMSDIYIEL